MSYYSTETNPEGDRTVKRAQLIGHRDFVLSITLGNAEMTTARDVADALRKVAQQVESDGRPAGFTRPIADVNGNRVGSYRLPGLDQ